MSKRYPGGYITKATPTVTTTSAAGVWTLEQQAAYQKAGTWPQQPTYIEDVFSTWLYTGTGSTQTITNGIALSIYGGMVWLKPRNWATSHMLFDTARGAGKILYSDATAAQYTDNNSLTAFNSNGFSLGVSSQGNASPYNYVGWTFRKQPKFFDVVTFTGNGQGYFGTNIVNHSLASVPGCVMIKSTSASGAWFVFTRDSSGTYRYLVLNTTAPEAGPYTASSYGVTSTSIDVAKLSDIDTGVNVNGTTYVAYLFAHNAGGFGAAGTDNVISCGSFTTDASGVATVNLGYEPQWVMVKAASATGSWLMEDTMRGLSQTREQQLFANSSAAESSNGPPNDITINATGFVTANSNVIGASTTTYIYIAIRRGPMKTPTTGTSVFAPVTSTSSTGTVQTTNFPVDLQFLEDRTGSQTYWMDRLRGVNPPGISGTTYYLSSYNSSGEAAAASGAITNSWNNTGFSTPSWYNGTNTIYESFRRAPGFFDVVCYTGTGSALAVSHNLAAVPQLMIVKNRNSSQSWRVYFVSVGVYSYMQLSSTATPTLDSGVWNNTAPTSTTFTVGTSVTTNGSGNTYVAYLFGSCPGVSKVGSYTGTGGTQTIDCGFTSGARFVMIKRADATDNWYYFDTARGMVAGTDPYLMLNSFPAEQNANNVYTTSVGFQLVSSAAGFNASGGTYVYLAIA